SLPSALVTVSARAGRPLWIPEDVQGLCCSTPWSSKGYRQGQEFMAAAIADALWRWTDQGALPVVVDASSCTHGLLEDVAAHLDAGRQECFAQLTIHDAVTWAHEELLPRLTVTHRLGSVALHPTCSTSHLGLNRALAELAAAVAEEVVVPLGTTCCGTAGDRGLLHPELVVSATEQERETLDARPFDAYLSANRTCEMGLHQATGRPYESFVLTLEEATRV
ncbi:MAG: heterodisulfide reductase-related iron-sulfur binding cluster, partial [Mycobacteriaceae bacterium]